MAPEIANGRYGREIDTYALGIILFEMLTGHVPFEGESVGEVLMKHLTAEPDLSVLAEPYRDIVRRALAKDPGCADQERERIGGAAAGRDRVGERVHAGERCRRGARCRLRRRVVTGAAPSASAAMALPKPFAAAMPARVAAASPSLPARARNRRADLEGDSRALARFWTGGTAKVRRA